MAAIKIKPPSGGFFFVRAKHYGSKMLSLTRNASVQSAIFLALMLLSSVCAFAEQRVTLVVNGHEVSATVAGTFAQRKKGLMNRRDLSWNEGMLFVFPQTEHHSMWMKNTLIPLSVAFIDRNGIIINIEEMAALSLDQHTAQKPAKYALEMNAGWFLRHDVKAGDTVRGLDHAAKTP